MHEAPRTPAASGRERALAIAIIAIIACLALSSWGIVHTRRGTPGSKRAPASAPLKPEPRERATATLDPEPVCLQAPSATRATKDA
jgi:hypothetical protein